MADTTGNHDAARFNPATAFTRPLLFSPLGLLPLIALAAYAWRVAAVSAEELIRANNLAVATLTRELVTQEFAQRMNTLRVFSRDPGLAASVRVRDEEAVRGRLATLVESSPRITRAFVTDKDGLLWSDFPKAPESLGQNFSHRDWYRGLSSRWEPYVSTVYRRNASPQLLLVAVAVPLRAGGEESGEVLGAVVYQITLEGMSEFLRQVEVGKGGFAYLLDHGGALAAHPRLDLQEREYREYAACAPVAALNGAQSVTLEYADPLAGVDMLATALSCAVGEQRWVVVAQQPVSEAFHPLRLVAFQLAGGCLLIAVIFGGFLFFTARYQAQTKRLNARLGELNSELSRENQERRRAEAELQRANDELERRVEEKTRELRRKDEQFLHAQKMEAVGQLAGGVAHDFNNLLTVINGHSDIMLQMMAKDDRFRHQIEEIRKAGERATGLTRQLLAFSRKQVLREEVLDLNVVVGQMDSLLRRLIGENVNLATNLAPGLDLVKADAGQIEQIVMNLAINARDAMPKGGKLTIETANIDLDEKYAETHADASAGPHAMIAVSDTGSGMDAATKARIFEPFFTTKEMGRGTGLGLSTVYGIVKQSGGNIWVYSEPGRGTTFKVYLPRATEAAAPPRISEKRPETPKGEGVVLLVEDEEGVRELIRSVLEMAGYTVLVASDAESAIVRCEEYQGDIRLLLTDVVLPGMDGGELAKRLAAMRPNMKVAYMSGYTGNAVLHNGVVGNNAVFIEKPVMPDTLIRKVHDLLRS